MFLVVVDFCCRTEDTTHRNCLFGIRLCLFAPADAREKPHAAVIFFMKVQGDLAAAFRTPQKSFLSAPPRSPSFSFFSFSAVAL